MYSCHCECHLFPRGDYEFCFFPFLNAAVIIALWSHKFRYKIQEIKKTSKLVWFIRWAAEGGRGGWWNVMRRGGGGGGGEGGGCFLCQQHDDNHYLVDIFATVMCLCAEARWVNLWNDVSGNSVVLFMVDGLMGWILDDLWTWWQGAIFDFVLGQGEDVEVWILARGNWKIARERDAGLKLFEKGWWITDSYILKHL